MSAEYRSENKVAGESSFNAHARVRMPSRKSRIPSCSSSSSAAGSSPPDGSSFSRQQRNLAEKQRRDKLNSYISELASLVPMISRSTKKLDKTSILRLSAAHLRLYHSCLNPKNYKKVSWRPNVFEAEHLNELLKVIDGFLVVTTSSAKIIFASKFVENYLGHQDIEMIGHSLFYFIHPDDHSYVRGELKKLTVLSQQKKNGGPVRCSFCVRMRERSQPRSEVLNYQLMRLNCCYTVEEEPVQNHTRRVFNTKQSKATGGDLTRGVLKFYVQPINISPFDELSITEAFQEEYVTRHGPSGEILFADHRISTITGHLPHEVIGMLAYDYIFKEDVPVAQFAQKLMFSSSDGKGMIVYRLRSRDATAVYLKTFGQLQYDKSSTKVSYFICVNKLLSEEEGKDELKKFNERYSPRINELLAVSSDNSQTLKSVKRCQMIENGNHYHRNDSTHAADLNVSPIPLSQYAVPSESSAPAVSPKGTLTITSSLSVNSPNLQLRNFNVTEMAASPQRLCNSSVTRWKEDMANAAGVQSQPIFEMLSDAVINMTGIEADLEILSSPEANDQESIGSEASLSSRKRVADMLSNTEMEPTVEIAIKSKHAKYNSGIARNEIVGDPCLKIANGSSRPTHSSEFLPDVKRDSGLLPSFCGSSARSSNVQSGRGYNPLSDDIVYDSGGSNRRNSFNSNCGFPVDMWTGAVTTNLAQNNVETHRLHSTDTEDRWLEGTVHAFEPRNTKVESTSSF